MAKRRFARKRGFKKPNNSETAYMGNRTKKHHRTNNEEIAPTFSPSVSGDSPVEHLEEAEVEAEEDEEVMLYKEPTVYDNLLKTLGSGSKSLANAYKKRQREEEGRSDSDGDLSSGSKSFSLHKEVDDESDDNSSKKPIARGTLGASEAVVSENSDNAETDDDDGSSDSDGLETIVNGQSADGELVSTSSFNDHLSYKLSEGDLDNLSKQKWKYKWEMPAVDMPNCKWTGTGECSVKDGDMNSMYGLKLKLYKHWLDMYTASGGSDFHSSKERSFFCMCNSYRDILHHNKKPFYLKGSKEDSSIMDAYIMHSLNHIFRTRDVVTKNDAKVAKCQENAKEGIFDGDAFLDHGFTRPKVLVLLPLSSMAFRLVKRLIHLTPSKHKVNVEHIDRFSDEFGIGSGGDKDKDEESLKSQKPSKPFDYQSLFGGNNNDHFMIGVKFTRRSIKLYSDFYSSDMIIASPLGLVTKIGEAEVEKEKDVDYLSSIEVLIIDHADVIAMQNWSHVNTMVEQLNRIPSKQHNTDIMRIRQWCLDGQAQFYRQTIILGFHLNPDIYALFNRHCCNFEGKVKLVCEYKGVLPKVLLQVRQVYERFDTKSVMDVDDARLEYFSKKVYPKIKDSIQGGIMLFVSSYFEFVRLRNFLKSQDASFCLLGEYTKQSDISRARVWFYHRKRKMMLYTERAHFYHRYKIRGIENLIIYSLPERKEFYPEIVNMLEGSHSMACTILFSSFDFFRLERIVGCGPAKRMVTSEKGVFVFC